MSTQRNRPGVETEATEVQAGRLSFDYSVAARSDIAPYDYPLDPIYEAKLLAWAQGWEARQAEVDYLNFTADRLYAEMCRRVPPKQVDPVPYARLQEIRAEIYAGAK